MNDDGQYLSHSDAEPIGNKNKPLKKFGNAAKKPSPAKNLREQRGFSQPKLNGGNLNEAPQA
jgi:hypothetical protein